MEETLESNKLHPSFPMATTSSLSPSFTRNQNHPLNFSPTMTNINNSATQSRRSGIPPIPPPSPSSASARSPSSSSTVIGGNPFHSRSVSQPPFFSLDSLPPLDMPLTSASNDRMPPIPWPLMIPRPPVDKAGHRRSNSDVPFGIPPPWSQPVNRTDRLNGHDQLVNKNSGENGDDFAHACMNLDSSEVFNSCGTEEKLEDFESSRMSGTRADSSENEAESSPNESYGAAFPAKRGGSNKRAASDNPTHCRNLSMDSAMHSQYYGSDSPTFPASPTNSWAQLSPWRMLDGSGDVFGLDFGNGEFTSAEVKKIMMNRTLAEMAQTDPKKVKRILANRQSAARSKERKTRYINELEHKVKTLQTEATTLSAQLTMMQRDSNGLSSQNNELNIRLKAMEREAELKEALNAALVAEVRHLKLANGEISESQVTKNIDQQA